MFQHVRCGTSFACARHMRSRSLVLASIVLAAAAACGGGGSAGDPDAPANPPDAPGSAIVSDPLHDLPTGVDQWTALCARGYGDLISQRICARSPPPVLTSLADLQAPL